MTPLTDFQRTLEGLEGNPAGHAVIFDVDGTLADVATLRETWLHPAEGKSDFQSFHAASMYAPVIPWVKEAAIITHSYGMAVVIVTGRAARWREHTAWWLALNGVPSDALYMRHMKDHRSDREVKQEMLKKIKASWAPLWAFDDNPSTIKVWRDAGIPVTVVPGWVTQD